MDNKPSLLDRFQERLLPVQARITLQSIIIGVLVLAILFAIIADTLIGTPANAWRLRLSASLVALAAFISLLLYRRQQQAGASILLLIAMTIGNFGSTPPERWNQPWFVSTLMIPIMLAPLLAPPTSAPLLAFFITIIVLIVPRLTTPPTPPMDPTSILNMLALSFLAMLAGRAIQRHVQEVGRKTKELELAHAELAKKHDQLQEAMDHLADASQTREALLATLSHDLRSPVATMIGYNDLLRDNLRRYLKPEDTEAFDVVQINGQYLLKLMEDLLNISKVQAGKLVLQPAPLDSRAFFEEIILHHTPKAERKGLALRLNISDPAPLLWADDLRLTQVMNNLISNGIKYTTTGHVSIDITANNDQQARIRVSDTGEGIPPADLPTIFEPFTQTARSRQRADSTGLGLSIAKHLIEAHGANITVESTLNQGTTFTILWPLAPTHAHLKLAA
jgi:signal transduction histidine kinase